MFSLTAFKNLIPFLFAGIIIFFLFSLNAENDQLHADNSELRQDVKRVNSKNDDLANTLNNLSERVGEMTTIVKDESRRRAAAEMKSQQLQEEVKDALKDNVCSGELVPDSVVERLRQQANGIRGRE
ncbi:MAG: DUF2570 domain-containing protein [Pantoea sp.]|uniref:DUF2570 domain-containing protein n=1 Tax=Pantoea sp. TaxID=69393 RepID=UPI00257DE38B|nr:DUF2570 domain-containing protein [Pantoea sp.]MBS6032030.1 DUF2570 domain-containing protein [Pantoea sp.]